MKTTKQSAILLPDLPPYEHIERAGRICYRSEPKGDPKTFVLRCWKRGHRSVLDMLPVGVVVETTPEAYVPASCWRFLTVDVSYPFFYVSGSLRAFLELDSSTAFTRAVKAAVAWQFPDFDWDLANRGFARIKAQPMTSRWLANMPWPMASRHIYRSVEFVTNRAVSHELVRHRPMGVLQESQRYCRYSEDKFGNEVTFIEPDTFFERDTVDRTIWAELCQHAEKAYLYLLKQGYSPQAARTVLPNSTATRLIVSTSLEHWQHILYLRTSEQAEPSMRALMEPLVEEFTREYPKFVPRRITMMRSL